MRCDLKRIAALLMSLALVMCNCKVIAYADENNRLLVYEGEDNLLVCEDNSEYEDGVGFDDNTPFENDENGQDIEGDLQESSNNNDYEINADENLSEGSLSDNSLSENSLEAVDENSLEALDKNEEATTDEGTDLSEEDSVDEELLGAGVNSAYANYYINENLPALKNQGEYNTCWAVSTASLAEINMMKKGYNNPDFSELHMAYFSYNSVVDPLGGTAGDSVRVQGSSFNEPGNNQMGLSVGLMNWRGLANESLVPYEDIDTVIENGIDGDLAYRDAAYLTQMRYTMCGGNATEREEQREKIKQLIMEYGGVSISYHDIEEAYNSTNNCYYSGERCNKCEGETDTDPYHMVDIVGWDNNFSRNMFGVSKPKGDGAWLIRNSWTAGNYSSSQSHEGYFWMSYYDGCVFGENSLTSAYAYGVESADKYDNNYQYDGGIGYNIIGNEAGSFKAANIFKACASENGEILKAVSFMTPSTNCEYRIKVYLNPTNSKDPTSGLLKATAEGRVDLAGYYTATLNNEVSLDEGDTYSVVVECLGINGNTDVGLFYEDKSTERNIVSTVSAKAGQSYLLEDGRWVDFGNREGKNIRIKAFTSNKQSKEVIKTREIVLDSSIVSAGLKLRVGETSDIAFNVLPENATDKAVIFTSSNESVARVDNNGVVTGVSKGSATIYASAKDGGASASFKVNVIEGQESDSNNTDIDADYYYISFDGNGATSGSMSNQKIYYGSSVQIKSNSFSKTGYSFSGWNTSADGSGVDYSNGQEVKNIASNGKTLMLYAQWTKKSTDSSSSSSSSTSSSSSSSSSNSGVSSSDSAARTELVTSSSSNSSTNSSLGSTSSASTGASNRTVSSNSTTKSSSTTSTSGTKKSSSAGNGELDKMDADSTKKNTTNSTTNNSEANDDGTVEKADITKQSGDTSDGREYKSNDVTADIDNSDEAIEDNSGIDVTNEVADNSVVTSEYVSEEAAQADDENAQGFVLNPFVAGGASGGAVLIIGGIVYFIKKRRDVKKILY